MVETRLVCRRPGQRDRTLRATTRAPGPRPGKRPPPGTTGESQKLNLIRAASAALPWEEFGSFSSSIKSSRLRCELHLRRLLRVWRRFEEGILLEAEQLCGHVG